MDNNRFPVLVWLNFQIPKFPFIFPCVGQTGGSNELSSVNSILHFAQPQKKIQNFHRDDTTNQQINPIPVTRLQKQWKTNIEHRKVLDGANLTLTQPE